MKRGLTILRHGSVRRGLLTLPVLFGVAGCAGEARLPGSYHVLTGKEIREAVAAQKGSIVVLNLWATWCAPCREEFPALVALDEKYRGRGVRVVAVSVDEPETIDSKVRPFVEQVGAKFPVWVKAEGDPMDFLDALNPQLSGALPETIIYDREGAAVHLLAGEQTLEQFEEAILELL